MRFDEARYLTRRVLPAGLAPCSCIAVLLWTAGCDPTSLDFDLQDAAPDDTTTPTASPASSGSNPDAAGSDPDANQTLGANLQATIHHEFQSIVVASWKQQSAAPARIEYSFDDGVWLSSPTRQRAAGPADELLLGIPYETPVQLRLVVEAADGSEQSDPVSITTGSLPVSTWKDWAVLAVQDGRFDPSIPYFLLSLYHYDSSGGTAIIDRQGRLVWARRTEGSRCTLQAQPSFDGTDLLIDISSFWAALDGGKASQVLRMKIDGTVLDTYDTPGLHHPFTQAPDGSIVFAANSGSNDTVESLSTSGEQRRLFSCADVSDTLKGHDDCGSNTIRWHEPTGTFLYSLYSHNAVLEIDPSTRTAVRVFGYQKNAYAFDPEDDGFWFQHGSHYTQDGTLMISSHAASGDYELVVREYEVDHDTQTLRLLWSFGEGEGVEGEEMGEAHNLPGGNVLHNYGSNPRLREVTRAGEVVWDVALTPGNRWEVGRSAPLADLYAFAP